MTLPTAKRLMDDTTLSSVAGLPRGRRNGHHQLGCDGRAAPAELGERRREARCRIAAGSRRPQRSHDVALDGERGREPARDCGRCALAGRKLLVQTGSGTRKGRNVARDPRCSIAVSIRDADVVAEGEAARETDPATLTRLAKAWADQGWPAELDETGAGITAPFNAPSQGPPPWNVYRIRPHSVTVALGTEPGGLTRFRF